MTVLADPVLIKGVKRLRLAAGPTALVGSRRIPAPRQRRYSLLAGLPIERDCFLDARNAPRQKSVTGAWAGATNDAQWPRLRASQSSLAK
jgi:hypothetical protein